VDPTGGAWARLASSIMRRPVPYFAIAALVMLALAYPATGLNLTGGDNRGVPQTTEATKGLALLEDTLGAGSLVPSQVVVDTGRRDGAWSAKMIDAQRTLARLLRRDPEIDAATVQDAGDLVRGRPGRPPADNLAEARKANLVSRDGRYLQVQAAGKDDSGTQESMDLVDRIRDDYVPAAGFAGSDVVVTGAPAFGVDFIDTAYSAFPWLVLAVLILSYLVLLRAFRSLFLPLKAVLMNLLSVGATYGVLVLAFQHGWGEPFGLDQSDQVEAWAPIFLFAMLFGLSMDYEVFLLSRMREEWERHRDNQRAVALGLGYTGRIITAAAAIMVAAFAGFTAGSFVGLQMFGLGLSVAILLDATIVRAILVPATMKLMGDWNWYLPERLARLMRLEKPPHAAVPVSSEAAPGALPLQAETSPLPSEAAPVEPSSIAEQGEVLDAAALVAATEAALAAGHEVEVIAIELDMEAATSELDGSNEALVVAAQSGSRARSAQGIASGAWPRGGSPCSRSVTGNRAAQSVRPRESPSGSTSPSTSTAARCRRAHGSGGRQRGRAPEAPSCCTAQKPGWRKSTSPEPGGRGRGPTCGAVRGRGRWPTSAASCRTRANRVSAICRCGRPPPASRQLRVGRAPTG
jgi:MMPL family